MSLLKVTEHTNYIEVQFYCPNTRNSFSLDAALELEVILKKYKTSAILFKSTLPKVFCSGGNLKYYAKMTKQKSLATNKKIRSVVKSLSLHKSPTVSIIDGDVLGGGIEVLAAFDKVLASPSSLFGLWQRKIALSYGWGGGALLSKRLSPQNLKTLSLEANIIDAYNAYNMGLVDSIVPSYNLYDQACQWLQDQLALPQENFYKLKNFETKSEVKIFTSLWGNPSHKKVLDKFK